MKRAFGIACVATALMIAAPRPASAGLWAWLQEMSGPGPFEGKQFDAKLFCFGNGPDGRKATAAVVSFCSPLKRKPFAVGMIYRSLSFTDKAAPAATAYAGGNRITLTLLGATAMWSPISDDRADIIDVGFSINTFWFATDGRNPGGFKSFKGVMLEPLRFELHAPSKALNSDKWQVRLLAVPYFQFSAAIFPAGFEPNAFGPDLLGEKALRLPAHYLKSWTFFFNLGNLIK